MSTKTSIKRIALVAVAALGFGMVSTVAVNAAAPAEPFAPTVYAGTSTPTSVGYTVTHTASTGGYVTLAASATADAVLPVGTTSVSATVAGGSILSGTGAYATCTSAGGVVQTISKTYAAGVWTGNKLQTGQFLNADCVALQGVGATVSANNPASLKIATPSAGTITVTIAANVVAPATGVASSTVLQSFTIIVSQGATGAVTASKASLTAGAAGIVDPITGIGYGAKGTAGAGAVVGDVVVTQLSGSGNAAVADTLAVSASITGVGSFSATAVGASYLSWSAGTVPNPLTIPVYNDGRAGTASVAVSVNGVVISTKTIKFYGDAAKVTATGILTTGRAGSTGYETGATYTCVLCDGTDDVQNAGGALGTALAPVSPGTVNNPAIAVLVTDANGTPVPQLVTATVADQSVIANGNFTTLLENGTSAGVYYQHLTYKSSPATTSGKKTTVTFSVLTSTGAIITSEPVAITLGGAPATITMTSDASTYAPGAAGTITVTAKDASGNAAYDGAALFASVLETSPLFGGKRPTATSTTVGGVKTFAFYAPVVAGDYSIIGTLTDLSTQVTLPITVSNDVASAAVDAATEATDAANAATDAANAAAEAADAATAAAQDAQAAVAELATQVATLMAGIKAQITSLTNLVIKIQKKVKA